MAELKNILMQDCVKAALEYIETGHVQRLRTNFNKLCKAWHADAFDPDELSLDVADIAKRIKEEPDIKHIAAVPAAERNSLQIEWVVEEFIHKYWLIEKEEITTKMVADVLLVADPLSRRHLVAQQIVIECIHALHTQQELKRLDKIMSDLATNPKLDIEPARDLTPDIPAAEPLHTKKATIIMPKEVLNALQRYCTESDTPKHRAVYLFILEGLHSAAAITDEEYQRFRDMVNLLTTTYDKK